ncbi:MAG: YceI family protein [Flavobacteriales bacterium]|nr:YceI family protein [Flavobacteriales bacterium]
MLKIKPLILVLSLSLSGMAHAQLLASKESVISFFSEATLENIAAENKAATSFINKAENTVAVKVPVNAFSFEQKLMQEHFNENYMESEKYPYATFKGKIQEEIDYDKDGTYPVTAKGKMNMHGVDRDVDMKGTLTIKNSEVHLHTEFVVKLEDYKIKIPSIVVEKIAEEVSVKADITYLPYEKK